jgi:hypothetical protein
VKNPTCEEKRQAKELRPKLEQIVEENEKKVEQVEATEGEVAQEAQENQIEEVEEVSQFEIVSVPVSFCFCFRRHFVQFTVTYPIS